VFFHPDAGAQRRARAVVKVQDGCDFRCAYCIVSIARGPSRSLPLEAVLGQLRAVAEKGFSEAVITGVNIGLYGKEHGISLAGLIEEIESAAGMPERIRLSSIEPHQLTDGLINVISSTRIICPHLHLPLQSGAPEMLRSMNRPYTPEQFEERIARITEAMPGVGLGLDVIAGFPGESEQAHENTVALIERTPASYLHVFPFSKRPGTAAADMPGRVVNRVIKERTGRLRELGAVKKRDYLGSQVGRTLMVLAEEYRDGELYGTSDNYVKASFPGDPDKVGAILPVKVERAGPLSVIGREATAHALSCAGELSRE
jgi:threonylcarbamoyladenosine tRNA methylthiotransferase MtaB